MREGSLHLEIPHCVQERMGWCVPACVEMVLKYLRLCHGPGIDELAQEDIAKLCKTTSGGTRYDAASLLSERTVRFTPSVEFEYVHNQNTESIRKQLAMNQPVIAFVEMETDYEQETFPHAILITGIDRRKYRVSFNDPMGKKDESVDIGRFQRMWEKDFCAWFVNVEFQRKITDRF